ncbi:phage terminase large subunit family protein [Chromobacterium subtsugae]|uniref:phage terminase large subunit family protein n=1 Tax=Chromobacterium subtsugae TaxID=251747 RepID=UPI00069C95A9|nr:phage terminase large subunit family protein [Chromobacterium subtsugae]
MDMSIYERQALDAVTSAWSAAFAPRVRMLVSEWADMHRLLTSAETSMPGPWRTSVVPFIREIMDSLSAGSGVETVVFMKPTQVAGTESLINWTGYSIDQSPGPMMVVQPTIELAELWSKQRLANMISGSESLRARIPPARSRDGGNTTLLKEYAGGVLRMSGANSAISLRSMPVGKLGLDEVDAYPDDLDGEGDPIGLALERTNNFPRRKVYMCSTPTVRGASNIEKWFERSDQRRYFVPCPHCQHKQHLRHQQFRYKFAEGRDGDPDGLIDAVYVCESCEEEIPEHHKTWMLENGEWIAAYPDRKIRGYHLNSYYSPVGLGRTWKERSEQFLRAVKDPIELKRFINTALAETWEDRTASIKFSELMQRVKPYQQRVIPGGVLLLTAGIDTQDDRLECYVWGWGRNQRCHLIDRVILYGDPAEIGTPEQPNVWQRLEELLNGSYRNLFGVDMLIEAAALDTAGHRTQHAYRFVRNWKGRTRLFAVIGRGNKPLVSRPSSVDVEEGGGTLKNGLKLWTVGVDHAKSTLYSWLMADRRTFEEGGGELFVNFPDDLDEDFFQQLTAEVYDPVNKKWKKRTNQPRNEALDCWNYAFFAACAPPLRIQNAQPADWDQREAILQPLVQDMFSASPAPATPTSAGQSATETSPASRGASSFQDAGVGWLDDVREDYL